MYRTKLSPNPWTDLFIWAVLLNRGEMAMYFWEMVCFWFLCCYYYNDYYLFILFIILTGFKMF